MAIIARFDATFTFSGQRIQLNMKQLGAAAAIMQVRGDQAGIMSYVVDSSKQDGSVAQTLFSHRTGPIQGEDEMMWVVPAPYEALGITFTGNVNNNLRIALSDEVLRPAGKCCLGTVSTTAIAPGAAFAIGPVQSSSLVRRANVWALGSKAFTIGLNVWRSNASFGTVALINTANAAGGMLSTGIFAIPSTFQLLVTNNDGAANADFTAVAYGWLE